MKRLNSGFTLIELIITLAVAAVLLGVALPSFTDLLQRNQLMTVANRIFTDLMVVRSEAVKRNQRVVMCKSSDGASCTTSGDWSQGWLIYVDADNDSTLDTGEVIVKNGEALTAGYNLYTSTVFNNRVTYLPDGSVTANGSFTVCDKDGEQADSRSIVLIRTGRPRSTKATYTCS